MALTVKTLGEGQVGVTVSALYTVPPDKAAIVKSMRFVNTDDTDPVTLDLYYLKSGGTHPDDARRILPAGVSLAKNSLLLEEAELTLGAGDKIEGIASAATTVDFVFSGIERDE